MERVVVTKVGDEPSPPTQPQSLSGTARKTQKTYPRGILKVKDPAKPPPMRKKSTKQSIRLVTASGTRKYRKTIRRKLSKMSDTKVRTLVEKHGLLKNKSTPPALMREMLEGGVLSGFISLK